SREGVRAGRVLLRAVRAAVRIAAGPRVDTAAAGLGRRRAGRARARVLRDRLLGVRDAPAAAEPEGDRLQPGRGVLPGHLAVLRSEHLRALPRAGDDRAGQRAAVGEAPVVTDPGHRGAGRALGRAADDALAVELRGAAAGPGGARVAALRRQVRRGP